jgi:outer membrane lipoprotein-sorting protein
MKYIILSLLFFPTLAMAKSFLPASFSANFEESFISHSGKEKKNFGKIDYQYPGRIRFEYTSPDPSIFVSNPKQSWYYVPPFVEGEHGQVTIQKSANLPLTKFLDSIKDGVSNSKMFEHKYEGKDLVLDFKSQGQQDITLKQAILRGTKEAKTIDKMEDFEKLTLVHADGKKVNLRFIEFKENVKFSESHFTFKVPAKTRTTNN